VSASHLLFDTLRQLADLADIRGESDLAGDYRAAASALESRGPGASSRIWQLALRDRLEQESTLDAAVRLRLRDLAHLGAPAAIRTSTTRLPTLVRTLLQRSTITSAEALLLVREFGIVTFDDLTRALATERLRNGRTASMEARLHDATPALDGHPSDCLGRRPPGRAPRLGARAGRSRGRPGHGH
jgi:hypothetical protein